MPPVDRQRTWLAQGYITQAYNQRLEKVLLRPSRNRNLTHSRGRYIRQYIAELELTRDEGLGTPQLEPLRVLSIHQHCNVLAVEAAVSDRQC